MPRTATERRILEQRQAKGVLVPILEEVLERQLSVDDEQDQRFMLELMKARARQREKGVFSPSMLSSCMRQAYFAKTGVEKRSAKSPRSNGFFLDGDFRHYKWQFALWKAHRAGLLVLLGCEIRVYHPSGDFAGTIDAIVSINGKLYVVDFKGMNVHAFQSHEKYGTKEGYVIQIVGYAGIVNRCCAFESFMGSFTGVRIEACLLVGENKGGPVQGGSPIALNEDLLPISKHRSKVKRRMHMLRGFVSREEVPPPECTSTRTIGFQECPFTYICREEVLQIQRQRESERKSKELSVSRPSRRADAADRSRSRTGSKSK